MKQENILQGDGKTLLIFFKGRLGKQSEVYLKSQV